MVLTGSSIAVQEETFTIDNLWKEDFSNSEMEEAYCQSGRYLSNQNCLQREEQPQDQGDRDS